MNVLNPGEELIAKEEDITSGTIAMAGHRGVNDAYDIYLAKEVSTGDYILVIFMKIQFRFPESLFRQPYWTEYEKNVFIMEFKAAVNRKWGNRRVIKHIRGFRKVHLDFRFETVTDAWCIGQHWTIYVEKIKSGTFRQSEVFPDTGRVSLNSEGFNSFPRQGIPQTSILHEFGHMLGIQDEYIVSSPYIKDRQSIMHSGDALRGRHDAAFVEWLEKVLSNQKGIKVDSTSTSSEKSS